MGASTHPTVQFWPDYSAGKVMTIDTLNSAADLQTIPGVGPKIAARIRELGYRSVENLRDQDPQRIYEQMCARQGGPLDRCVLYVLRCAVYYASHQTHRAGLLKWWSWKD